MLITTTSASRLASSTRVRCPSCSAPMVGTRATLCPFARTSATTWRISEIVSTDFILEAVIGIRICTAANVAGPASQRVPDVLGHLGVALEKLRLERVVQAKHIG